MSGRGPGAALKEAVKEMAVDFGFQSVSLNLAGDVGDIHRLWQDDSHPEG